MFPWRHAPNQWRTWCLVKFDLFMISKITYNKNIQQEIEHCNNYVWQNAILITWRENQLFLHYLGTPIANEAISMFVHVLSFECCTILLLNHFYTFKAKLRLAPGNWIYIWNNCTHKCINQLCLMVSSLKHITGFTGHKM